MNVPKALADLGDTPDAVAATLRAAGATGVRRANADCPVANYLAAMFPGHRFEVTPARVQIDGEGRVVIPEAVADFVDRFDDGKYRELRRMEDEA